ncbi:MAG: MFS transporter [Acidimicrobiales bacterium]|nr:MFS transporter [Acidimicrobiales bacterium]
MRLPQRLAALRERNYRLLFAGQVFSLVGDEMTPVAISFGILDHGGTARQVGFVLGAGTATMVLLLLLGGALADRLSRRWMMLTADTLRAAVQGSVAVLFISGHWQLWQLVALEAVWGVGAAFFNPAITGLLPQLLTGETLTQANALQNLSWSVGSIAGPALAGVLVATVGPGPAIAVDAGSFIVSALLMTLMRAPLSPVRERASLLKDLHVGWREFRSRTWLWVIVVEFGLWHLTVYAPVIVLGAVVAKTHLGGAGSWGVILSAFGIGALLGGLVALRYRPRRPLLAATLATMGFVPLPALLAAAAPVPAIAFVAAIGGGGFALFGTLWDTTLQAQVPQQVLSRVSSYDWFGSIALLPVGYALAGPVANAIGVRTTLYAAAVLMAVEVLCVLAVPSVRQLGADVPELDARVVDGELCSVEASFHSH